MIEIVGNHALRVITNDPDRITSVIHKSALMQDGSVLAHWDLGTAKILQNLGYKAPSPILGDYDWPGVYTPFAHQRETAGFVTLHQKGYVLSSVGSGKTMAMAWASDYLMKKGLVKRVLIICPLSIMSCAWRNDLFNSVMHRKIGIAHGTRPQRLGVINSNAEYVIINYDGVESVRDALAMCAFDMIICDESTQVKNAKTKRFKMINSLVRENTRLWLMTGTPCAQSPMDAYGQIKLVHPRAVSSNEASFKDKVMHKVSMFKWEPKSDATEYVYSLMQPAIRFTKEECLDLPEELYTTREVSLTTQQKKYYDIIKKEMLLEVAGTEITAVNAAVQMSKLLQIAAGSVRDTNNNDVVFDCSHKLEEMLDCIQQSSHKTLVFCTFRSSIETVLEYLSKQGISADAIHGDVSVKRRTAIFDRFQTSPDPQVLVIQPQSAAHGVTLTAANTIVWFSPTTSAETYLQANARTHRAGQKNPCLVIHLCSCAVERKLYKALETRTLNQAGLLSMYKNFLGEEP